MTVSTEDQVPTAVAESRGIRVRFPIALKLILASVALVLLLSGGFIAEGVLATQRQYAQFAASQQATEIAALSTRGLSTARNLADGMVGALIDGDVARIGDMVAAVARGDGELVDATVARTNGRVIARAKEGRLGGQLPTGLLEALSALTGPRALTDLASDSLPEVISFGAPIETGSGVTMRREGYLVLDMSTARIAQVLREIEVERARAVASAIVQTVALGAAALLIGILLAVAQGLRFGRAIRHLAQVAVEVGRGNLKARATPTTFDEIGFLCARFNEMTGQVDNLMRESAEKAVLDREIERANAIQSLLVPPRGEYSAGGLTYAGFCEAATKMGGDWWHHYVLPDDRVMICIGDVTGHGIPSAMLTASAKACCDTYLFDHPVPDLARFMASLDHTIREAGKGELIMTFFAALFDLRESRVEFANAGHNFPMVFGQGPVSSLVARGGRLGDGTTFAPVSRPLASGDLVVFFTDGLLECTNPEGEEYGLRRMRRFIGKHAQGSPVEVLDRLLSDANSFYAGTPRIDDVTLVACRVG